jgi:arylsulfatase
MSAKPNVIMIMTDQQRADMVGPDRHPCANFQALERLRDESVSFEQFYTAAVPCIPSRHVFLTGRDEWTLGVDVNRKFSEPDEATWMSILREDGYKTLSVGKTHEIHAGSHHVQVPVGNSFNPGEIEPGFNHYEIAATKESDESYFDLQTANRACSLLGELKPRGPFAMFIGFHSPHEPYVMPQKYIDAVADVEIPVPVVLPHEYETKCQSFKNRYDFLNQRFGPIDDEKTRTGIRGYMGLMTMIDECVGRVLDRIESLGLLNDTIIIFTSDHGDVLGEHGIFNKTATFYEGEVRIPFFVRLPGGGHKSITGLGSNIDFVPTLFDLLELTPDISLPGHSLKPMISGAASPRDHVLCSIGPAMMIRTESSKLWLDSRFNDGELYDLNTDPKEQHNLFNNPAHAETRGKLTERLLLERIRSDVRNNKATEREWNLSLEVAVTGEPEVGYAGR